METLMERLTTSEAAIVAGVSVPQIHRIIDEKILPENLYSTKQMRTFRTDACILIAFYFETAESLTAQARFRTIRNAMAHCGNWRPVEELCRRRSVHHGSLLCDLAGRGGAASSVNEGTPNGSRGPRNSQRDPRHQGNASTGL